MIRRKTDNTVFVADTKWKLLDVRKPHYGVSQSDLYQMAIYQYKYHAQNVTLLYPRSSSIDLSKPVSFTSKDGLTVHLRWIDWMRSRTSLLLQKRLCIEKGCCENTPQQPFCIQKNWAGQNLLAVLLTFSGCIQALL